MHNSGCARDGREMCALSSWSSICGAGAFVRCTSCMLASAQSKSAQLSVFGRVWCLWIGWTKLDIFCVLNLKKWYRTPLEIDLRSQDRTRVCIPCDAGHYQPLPGESTCLLCEPGTRPEFQNAPNMCFENFWTWLFAILPIRIIYIHIYVYISYIYIFIMYIYIYIHT